MVRSDRPFVVAEHQAWVSLTGAVTPAAHRIALKSAVPALTANVAAALVKCPALSRRVLASNAGSYRRRVRRMLRQISLTASRTARPAC